MPRLDEAAFGPDPIEQFKLWFAEASRAGADEPDGVALATAAPDGRPSARMVLLRGVDRRGFVFFTNYESRKGRELALNPYAALERRVRDLVARPRHDSGHIRRPDHWGGYRVVPSVLEFWQSGPHRLLDRLRYRRLEDGAWLIERLAP